MIKELLLRNWQLKLLALFLAFVLWIILIPEEKTFAEKNLSINLELVNIPADVEVLEPPDTTLNLRIRARKRLLNEIKPESITARLDMSRASIYQQEYLIDPNMIKVPAGVEIVNYNPAYVHVKLDRTKKLEMEVVPTIIGRVPEGYRLVKTEVSPARVMVAGPESKIRPKDRVITSPIDVSTLTASTIIDVDLILPRPELRLLTPYPRARVTLVIEKTEGASSSGSGSKRAARNVRPEQSHF